MKMFKYAFLWVTLFVSSSYALTLSDIETQVRRNVRDTGEVGNQSYPDAVLDGWINEAQREIVNLTWCVEKSTSYVLSAGTTYYDLPDDFLAARFVTFTNASSNLRVLDEYSFRQVYQDEPNFESSSIGEPTHYMTRVNDTAGSNLVIAYIPIPSSSSTGTVKIWYTYYPVDMSSDSDVPFDGELHLVPYHYSIVAHVTSKIKAIEARGDEAKFYMDEFQRYVVVMAERFGARPNYSPSVQGAPR